MLIPRLCLSRAAVAGGAWDSVPAARLPRRRGGGTRSTHRPTRGSKFVHADLPAPLEVVDDGRGRWHPCLSHDPRPTRFLVPGVGRVLLYSLRFNTHRRGKLRLGQRGGWAATGPASAGARRFGAGFDAAKVTHWESRARASRDSEAPYGRKNHRGRASLLPLTR